MGRPLHKQQPGGPGMEIVEEEGNEFRLGSRHIDRENGSGPWRRGFAIRPQFGESRDWMGNAVVEDFKIGCVQPGNRAAERVTNGEWSLHQIGFSVQNRRWRRVGVSADDNFLHRGRRRLGAEQERVEKLAS